MASISKINGQWRALIRRKGHTPVSKYFPTKSAAQEWAAKIEADIKEGRVVQTSAELTVAELIDRYRRMRDEARPIPDTSNEHYMLKALAKNLGTKKAGRLSVEDLTGWATRRKDEGAGPYTINMELSKLGTVYRYAGIGLKLGDPTVESRPLLTHLRLIGSGNKRERRPTETELPDLIAWLAENRGQIYADAVEFAAHTAMRRGEITEILWKDVDEKKRLVGVWRKHPRKAKVWELVPLLVPAWDLLQRQSKDDERIFPIHPQTLSKYFREGCAALGIPDLHFHDLRHEGTSRLFEEGYAIEQVALVTGHKDWRHLRRYTNLRPESLHELDTRPGKSPRRDSPPSAASRRRKSAE